MLLNINFHYSSTEDLRTDVQSPVQLVFTEQKADFNFVMF